MEKIDFNTLNQILERNNIVDAIKKILCQPTSVLNTSLSPSPNERKNTNMNNPTTKKCIYIYGNSGIGKTQFAIQILKECGFDYLLYDAGNIRNKSVIDDIVKHNSNQNNIMSIFHRKKKQIAIIMDEIDGMNNGDKGGINTLIKLIRQKKTKKQQDDIVNNPIICIGNYKIDKKIKELMKVCNVFELKEPTNQQIHILLNHCIAASNPHDTNTKPQGGTIDPPHKTMMSGLNLELIVPYIQGDLRKLNMICHMYEKNPELINEETFSAFFQYKAYNNDTKKITNNLFHNSYKIEEHNTTINETDRTSIGLLWHENIIDYIHWDNNTSIQFYIKQLNNICFADYIDRVTFQKQIWQFNEMSSLIKTMKNNYEFKETLKKHGGTILNNDIRFTKVLTKYSTEYNNFLFIQNLCQQLSMDKKDLFGFFYELSLDTSPNREKKITYLCENYEIKKLDIQRINRYIDKYINITTNNDDEDIADIDDLNCFENINDEYTDIEINEPNDIDFS